jgi:futalosine hydrolase
VTKVLLLIPTSLEFGQLDPALVQAWQSHGHVIALCGFGLAVSGARTMQEICRNDPTQVVLLGIAGSLSLECPVGTIVTFDEVRCTGIGVGDGESHQSASKLGWKQWDDQNEARLIGDLLPLARANHIAIAKDKCLLSVASASSTVTEAHKRTKEFPEAVAEDMEGFSVASACSLAKTRLTIVRGISNVAGNRNHAEWNIKPVLNHAMRCIVEEFAAS